MFPYIFFLSTEPSHVIHLKTLCATISTSLPSLACASTGIHAIQFRCQLCNMPSCHLFPTLIHQATQIFSPNPPFARTPIPLKFGNTIWIDDWIPVPSNITGSLVSCLPGSNKMSCFPFGTLNATLGFILQIPDVPQWNRSPGHKPACWSRD